MPFAGATPFAFKRIALSGLRWEDVADCSFIERICYDVERAILYVCFNGSTYYEYREIPPQIVEAFKSARDLKGEYFNANIRKRFAFSRLF